MNPGYVDGAAVDSAVYEAMAAEDPAILEKTRVILESAPFPGPSLVVFAGIDPKLEETLLAALLGMQEDAEGREILSELNLVRFAPPDKAAYDAVRTLAKKVEHH